MNYNNRQKKSDNDVATRILSMRKTMHNLEALGDRKIYPKNHILVHAEEMPQYCYIVKRGRVCGYEYLQNGVERIYYLNEGNSLLLEANVIYDVPSPVNFKTMVQSELIRISKTALLDAIYNDIDLLLEINESLAMKFLCSMEQIRHSNYHNAEWKICDLLISFAHRYGVYYDGKILIQEKMSQMMIANLLGINRVTAVRCITRLKDMALIENLNGYYCIRNMDELKRHQEKLLL